MVYYYNYGLLLYLYYIYIYIYDVYYYSHLYPKSLKKWDVNTPKDMPNMDFGSCL